MYALIGAEVPAAGRNDSPREDPRIRGQIPSRSCWSVLQAGCGKAGGRGIDGARFVSGGGADGKGVDGGDNGDAGDGGARGEAAGDIIGNGGDGKGGKAGAGASGRGGAAGGN
eukprot:6953475-Prymnesium_polylepis.1